MTIDLASLHERICQPISAEMPCGENARYDPRYAIAKNEIMKLTAGSSAIDWPAVLNSTRDLLCETTKDLTLVAYLNLALLKIHQYPGLEVGLNILHHLLDNYWEPIFPPIKRLRARIQVFEWLDERLSGIASMDKPEASQREALVACQKSVDLLREKVQTLIKGPVTGFSRIRAELQNSLDQLPTPAKAAAPPAATPPVEDAKATPPPAAPTTETAPSPETEAPSAATPSPAADPPAPEGSPAAATDEAQPAAPTEAMAAPPVPNELSSIDEGLKAVAKITHLIREVQPLTPVAYRLARVLKWENAHELPPSDPSGQTKIPPPSDQQLNLFDIQLKAKNWPILTATAENLFISGAGGTFNFNLQRYIATGLENQGANNAAEVVVIETGRLLTRLPGLAELTYNDGRPFADDETKPWLQDAIAAAGPTGSATTDEQEDRAWLKEVTQAVSKKSMARGLELIQQSIQEAKDTKNVMKRRLDVAKFFHSHREYQWAVPILESLNTAIDDIRLVEWDPNFCAEVWEYLLKGYNALPQSGTSLEDTLKKRTALQRQLFDVSVVKAAAITPKPKKH